MVDVDCTCTGSLLQWFLTFTCCTIVTHQLHDDDSSAFATKDMVRELLSNVMRPCDCKASLNGVPVNLFSSICLSSRPFGSRRALHFKHFLFRLVFFSTDLSCLCVNLRLQQSYVLLLHLWRWLHQLINWNGKDIRGVTLYVASVENGNTLKNFTFVNT